MSYFAGYLGVTIDRGFVLVEEEPAPPSVEGYANTVIGLAGGGPLAYWRFGTTSAILDEIGSRDGTYSSSPTLVAGLPATSDGAINFGGVSTGTVPHDAGLSLTAVTILAWFQIHAIPLEGQVYVVLAKDQAGGTVNGDFSAYIDSNAFLTVNFASSSANFPMSVAGIEVGTPYALVIRADSAGIDFFLNGQLIDSRADFTDALASNTRALFFATAEWTAVAANLTIDEVAIYPRRITIAEAIELSHATSAPVADNFAIGVNESATTAIDVAANCTFIGDKADLTVTAVSQPAGGDSVGAANVNNDLPYTAGAVSVDTARSFTYKIEDANGESNTATVSVTVLNTGTPPASDQANCFVEAGGSVVTSMTALQTAVNAASPGANILIAPGSYSGGTLSFNRDGTEANPIVIRPQSGLGTVTINGGGWTLEPTSSWIVIEKLHREGGTIYLQGSHNRISRCRFRNFGGSAIETASGGNQDCRIDHCEFSNPTGEFSSGINYRSTALWGTTSVRLLVDYCYFHDFTIGIPTNGFVTSAAGVNATRGQTAIWDHCLIQNIFTSTTSEVVINKMGGMIYRFCTFENCGDYFQWRIGGNCELRSSWFESVPAPKIFGKNSLVIGNRFVGSVDCWCPVGNVDFDTQLANFTAHPTGYAASENSSYIGNRFGSGTLRVGDYHGTDTVGGSGPASVPAQNSIVHANIRDSGGNAYTLLATRYNVNPAHTGTSISSTTSVPFVPAVKLTSSNVGLLAADPLCD